MANEFVNKVVYGGETLIDLTADTISPSDVINSKVFHDASGATRTGTCTYDADTSDATATASEILTGKTAYKSGSKITGTMPNRGAQTGKITLKAQEITIQNGYHDGSGKVSIDSTEQAKIIASNILEGVTILGVTGTVEPSSEIDIEPSKTFTPTVAGATILPSEGYDALAQVVVSAIPYSETDNASGGKTVTIA